MEGRVFKRTRSKFWWIAWHVGGVEYRESSASSVRSVAVDLLKKRLRERDTVGPPRGETLSELLDTLLDDYRIQGRKYLSQTYYHISVIRRRIDDIRASDVTTAWLRRYVNRRLDDGAANATMKRAMNIGRVEGHVIRVPVFPHLREDNARSGFFERHEVELLVRTLPDYLQDLTRFAWLTGWRKGEVTGLMWDRVDLNGRTIALPTS
jgi:integrase